MAGKYFTAGTFIVNDVGFSLDSSFPDNYQFPLYASGFINTQSQPAGAPESQIMLVTRSSRNLFLELLGTSSLENILFKQQIAYYEYFLKVFLIH